MCGRTSCTLNPDQISRATRYRNSKGKNVEPRWRKGDKDKYHPSYNKAPMSFCPVMLHTKHLEKVDLQHEDEEPGNCQEHERAIISMKWGLIPKWVKDPKQAQYKMNNARSDTMLTKTSYKRPLEKGQRCVVLADGFYEWNTTKTEKQPYYIYFKNDEEIDQKPDIKKEVDAEENLKKPDPSAKRILTMAGIFERRKSEKEDEDESYSFTVITVDSHPQFTWLHHRMPAMLRNDDEVRKWLDFGETPLEEAVELIEPKDCLSWHPVSKFVNNSRNNSPECLVEIDLSKPKVPKTSSESKGMAKWLSKSPTKIKTEIIPSPLKMNNKNKETKPEIKQETPTKGQKRQSSGSMNMMEGWLKRAKKD